MSYVKRLPHNQDKEINFDRKPPIKYPKTVDEKDTKLYFTNTTCPLCKFSSIYFKQATLAPINYDTKVENIKVSITANSTQATIYAKAIGKTGLGYDETVKVNYLIIGKYKD